LASALEGLAETGRLEDAARALKPLEHAVEQLPTWFANAGWPELT
jgi:hypothetical protein